MFKLVIETRLRRRGDGGASPWSVAPDTQANGYATFADARPDLLDSLVRGGFDNYANCVLLVDDLNPYNYTGEPIENILTSDGGLEIRVRRMRMAFIVRTADGTEHGFNHRTEAFSFGQQHHGDAVSRYVECGRCGAPGRWSFVSTPDRARGGGMVWGGESTVCNGCGQTADYVSRRPGRARA